MPDDFAHRLELAMRAVAHEVGVASAYQELGFASLSDYMR